jgi:diacylglycerol kinase (ATP)
VGGNLATFATLASALGKTMFFKPNANDPNRFDKPYPITLKTDGKLQRQGPQLLMLATTLGNSFWVPSRSGVGPLHPCAP